MSTATKSAIATKENKMSTEKKRETLTLAQAADRTRETDKEFAEALDLIIGIGKTDKLRVSCYAGIVYSLEADGLSMGSGAVVDLARGLRTPMVGSPAVFHVGSDRYAGTIECVSPSGKSIGFKCAALGHFSARRSGRFGEYRVSKRGYITTNDNSGDYRSPEF